jgi:hypothetical protein
MKLTRLVHMFTPIGMATIVAGSLAMMPAVTASAAQGDGTVSHLTEIGTGTLGSPAAGSGANTTNEIGSNPEVDQKTASATSTAHVFPTINPNPRSNGVAGSNPGASGFDALNHFDTRTASGGNQFSLEPPDQGLCVNGTYVVEPVNDVVAVYRVSDHVMTSGPTAMNAFFGLAFAINRTTGVRGPFLSDPKCYFDASTNRWFLTILEEDPAPSVRAHTLIAVSQTSNPNGMWSFFSIDATDDGLNGTPSHANCPCFGDQPLIGADKFGFYISTNEFKFIPPFNFNGAQVYAISKSQLVEAAENAGPTPAFVHINAGALATPDAGALWYSIQPATAPPSGDNRNDGAQSSEGNNGGGGIEYFLSALQFGPQLLDNRIAAWALTNTSSLGEDPNVKLSVQVIRSETYGQPPDATQKDGPRPLGTLLGEPLELIAGNDDRMNQVVFANGLLWSGVNTIIQTPGGPSRVGIAYFLVRPGWRGSHLAATMASQGYVSVAKENVLYPSIGVNASGQAIMSFSLSGPGYFPSAAYAAISADGKAGKVHIAGAGTAPEDGFSGYAAFGGAGTARWGDYSAAVAAPDGSIWIAAEYIPNRPRTQLANWGTFITNVTFGEGDSQNQS